MSELGDKTFIMSAILAMRHPAATVLWGSWSAMIVMSLLSSLMGAVLPAILSAHMSAIIAAFLFFGFGCAMLWQGIHMTGDELGQEWIETQEEIRADEEEHELDDLEAGMQLDDDSTHGSYPDITPYPPKPQPQPIASAVAAVQAAPKESFSSFLREGTRNLCGLCFSPVFSQAFLLSFVGEWGDRSQITTVALAATHVRDDIDAATDTRRRQLLSLSARASAT